MKKIILTTIIVLFALSSFAQETLKYKDNENSLIEFKISTNEYFVKVNNIQKQSLQKDKSISEITEISENLVIIQDNSTSGNYKSRKSKISQKLNRNISDIEPVLIYKDGIRQVCNGEIIIKLRNEKMIDKLFSDYEIKVTSNDLGENQFLIKIKDINTFKLLDLVSKLQKNSKIDFIEPNFIRLMKPHTNDPFFNSQWSINNQGYLGGTVDADMDVDDAWSISTGSGVKIAIIDEGVDLTHDDLTPNLLSGYDATGGNSNGAPSNNDAHGTSCAGIVSAVANNNIGIAGIAYNAKIIPVRIAQSNSSGQWVTDNNKLANGITWAYQNGADILSNSWGGGSPSSAITNAINNAVNFGRNGKGCLVLFSSGNHNTDVAYPATLSNVVAVGATNMFDERKSPATAYHDECWYNDCHGGSNFGAEIDVVAPGVFVYTTDISGSAGYSSGDYKSNFNGTSSACPQVAGIAALVLSLNPNFTQTQVREILETTTDKIGGYTYNVAFQNYGAYETWNNEVGYGRVNAFSAVQKALNYDSTQSHYISGPTQITPGTGGFYSMTPYVYATNYVWTIPTGCTYGYCWEIVQGQGTSSPLIHGGSTGVFDITCKIYNGSTLIGNQYITVNVQNPYNGGGGGNPCEPYFAGNVIYPPIEDDCNENFGVNNTSENIYFKKIVIYNFLGQVVLEIKNQQGTDISHLSSGIYIVKMELSNNEIKTKKIYKE